MKANLGSIRPITKFATGLHYKLSLKNSTLLKTLLHQTYWHKCWSVWHQSAQLYFISQIIKNAFKKSSMGYKVIIPLTLPSINDIFCGPTIDQNSWRAAEQVNHKVLAGKFLYHVEYILGSTMELFSRRSGATVSVTVVSCLFNAKIHTRDHSELVWFY